MHEVQAFTRFGVPPTTVRTRWMLGFQRRDVRRCECEMLLPKPGPLPQTSQLAATGHSKDFRCTYGQSRHAGIEIMGSEWRCQGIRPIGSGNRSSIQRLRPYKETTTVARGPAAAPEQAA